MTVSASSRDLIIALIASVIYMAALAFVIPLVLGNMPSWWVVSENRWISLVSWDQLTHTVAILILAAGAAFLANILRPHSLVRVAWLAALFSLVGFIGSTIYTQQTDPIIELTMALMWESKSIPLAIFIFDCFKICAAIPLMSWLLWGKPSNNSQKADGSDGP